jgi:hypothetical protein
MKINPTNLHPSAFISSTFLDLKEEREAVATVLEKERFNVNALDVRPASNTTSKDEILNGIQASDFIVLIVGERYGSIIPAMTKSDKLSITEWEYRQARLVFRRDVLVFFKNVNDDSPINFDDVNSDFGWKKEKLERFKKLLSHNHKPDFFSKPSELAEKVRKALILTYRTGVIDLSSKVDLLNKENDELRQKVKYLSYQEDQKLIESHAEPSGIQSLGAFRSRGNLPRLGTQHNSSEIENYRLGLSDVRLKK